MRIKCKRFFLVPSVGLFIVPIFLQQLQNVIWIAIMNFSGTLLLLINFPSLSTRLHSRPIFVEDLIMEGDIRYKKVYEIIMIFFLSLLVAIFADYLYVKGINTSPFEFLALIGGNSSMYLKLQDMVGKIILKIAYHYKSKEQETLEV